MSSPGKNKSNLRRFNKKAAYDIQKALKAKAPDIAAAFVLHDLLTWKSSRKHVFGGRLPGAVYLSLSDIQKDLPWLSASGINGALKRLEKAFAKDVTIDRKSKREHNFLLSDKLQERYFSKCRRSGKGAEFKFISVRLNDAVDFGVLKAVLISNLEHKTNPDRTTNPVVDTMGKIYGEMSATTLSRPSKLSKVEAGKDKLPILPFSRQSIQTAIKELQERNIFVEHPDRAGFFRLNRGTFAERKDISEVSTNGKGESANCNVVSPYRKDESRNCNDYSVKLKSELGNELEGKLESDFIASTRADGPCVEAKSCDLNSSERPTIPRLICQASDQQNQEANPIHFTEKYPEMMEEVNTQVRLYRSQQKVLSEEEEHRIWVQEELPVNPLTGRPVDLSNFEELVDIAMDELNFPQSFKWPPSQKSLSELRQVFHRYEGVTPTMIQTMLDRIDAAQSIDSGVIGGYDEPKPPRWWWRDDQYFAKVVTSFELFVRYFPQLFVETFAPYVGENQGIERSPQRVALRSWTVCEFINKHGEPEYPKTHNYEEIQEPFRTLFDAAIQKEMQMVETRLSPALA